MSAVEPLGYAILDPTGNITALVETPVDPARQPETAAALMARHPQVEQVGFLSPPAEGAVRGTLRMAGGEFCGNATMSAAALAFLDDSSDAGEGPRRVLFRVSGAADLALLPQPFVTVAKGKVEGLRVALDMTKEWAAAGDTLITAGLIVRTAFLNEHPEAVKVFLEEYAASTAYANEHPAEAAVLVEQFIGVKAAIAEKAIPACNIVCVTGEEMKQAAQGYLQVLFDLNPKAVGGALPADDFYYLP